MTNALITGIAGFAGSHLAEFLLTKGYRVAGLDYAADDAPNIKHIQNQLEMYECDLRNPDALRRAVSESEPDEVYHLAAIAHVPTSYSDVRQTFDVNLYGTLNLFEAVRKKAANSKVLFVGTASEYGAVKDRDIPTHEDVPLRPVDPYGVSKAAADMLAYQYYKNYGLRIVRVRPFNHIGPRQAPDYVVASFAKQIAGIEKQKSSPVITVGNLEARRDFTDVRDMVRAYWLALQKGEPGEVYNICSGRVITIQEVLDKLLELSEREIKIEQDVERLRPADIPLLLGNSGKFRGETGWEPKLVFERTLQDIVHYWRGRVE
jgi:GDP-4-dehydro-6-deoxy-D-mannose reductase